MRVSTSLCAIALFCALAVGCSYEGPVGPPATSEGDRTLAPTDDTCDPIVIPC